MSFICTGVGGVKAQLPTDEHLSPKAVVRGRVSPAGGAAHPGEREPCASFLCQRLFMHFIQLLLNAKCIRSPWSRDRNPRLSFAVFIGGADPLGQFPASAE